MGAATPDELLAAVRTPAPVPPRHAAPLRPSAPAPTPPPQERTFLAWVRTIIAVVGLGVVLGRLFRLQDTLGQRSAMMACVMATVFLGLSTWRYYSVIERLNDDSNFTPDYIGPALVSAFVAGMIGVAMVFIHRLDDAEKPVNVQEHR